MSLDSKVEDHFHCCINLFYKLIFLCFQIFFGRLILASVDLLTTKLSDQPIETKHFPNLLKLSKASWSESLTHNLHHDLSFQCCHNKHNEASPFLFVCLSVCLWFNNPKTTKPILWNFAQKWPVYPVVTWGYFYISLNFEVLF